MRSAPKQASSARPSPGRRGPDESFDFDGEYGAEYEALAHRVIPAYAQLFTLAVALLDRELDQHADIMVVGCGTGNEMVALGREHPHWQCTGVDPSAQMIRSAQYRVEREGMTDRHRFHHGYVDDLPETPGFDAVTVFNVLHFLPDDGAKAALIQGVANRLRPGAPLVIIDLYGEPHTEEFGHYMDAWERFMRLNGMTETDQTVFLDRLAQGIHWVPQRRVLELLESAGFDHVAQFFRALLYGGWIARRKPS